MATVAKNGRGRRALAGAMATAAVASALVGVVGGAPPAAAAGVSSWSGAVSDRWSEPGNWRVDGLPVPGRDLFFMDVGARSSSVNDLPAGVSYPSLNIRRAGFAISGNAIGVTESLLGVYGSGTSTIGMDLAIPDEIDVATTGGTLALTGAISGPGGLAVSDGHVRLDGENTFTGTTRASGGVLEVGGALAGPVELAGGTLAGNGTLQGSSVIASTPSTIAPGPPGRAGALAVQVVDGLLLSRDVRLRIDIDGPTAGAGYDQLRVTPGAGGFEPNGAALDLDLGYLPSVGSVFQIVEQAPARTIGSRFAGHAQNTGFTDGPVDWNIRYDGSGVRLIAQNVRPVPAGEIVVDDPVLTPGETSPVRIYFNEAVTDFDVTDLAVPNGALTDLVSSDGGASWTATLTPSAATHAPANVITLDNTGVRNAAGYVGFGPSRSNEYAVDTARLVADRAPLIGGVPQVGGALTAVPGGYSADPEDFDFAWRAGSRSVGTDSPVYRPSSDDIGQAVTVTVTAHRAGLTDAVTVSDPTTPVAGGGLVRAWGSNFDGVSTVPAVLARSHTVALAAGFSHSLALSAQGRVRAWGAGQQGTVPDEVAAATVTAIGAGANHSLAVTSDGHVSAWGTNSQRQIEVPPSLSDVVAVAGGSEHSLALTADGRVRAWGANGSGQSVVPISLDDRTVVAIAAGSNHSLALTSDGQVTAWGANGKLQSAVPDELDGETVVAIAAGLAHSLALTADGRVVAWGDNSQQQTTLPGALSGKTVVAIGSGAGSDQSVALTSDRQVVVWGANPNGVRVVPPSLTGEPVAAVAMAGSHALALTSAVVADGPPTIVGTPRVGTELTVDLPTFSVRPDELAVQWYADDTVIAGADELAFTPTPAQRGAALAARITVKRAGHRTLTDRSADVGPVADGVFAPGPVATITGTPQVDSTLTADAGSPAPAADSLTYAWAADGVAIDGATGRTLAVTPDLVGAEITVTVTAKRDGYADASDDSDPTAEVAQGTFSTGPTAGIDGDPVVGRTLVATVGLVSPSPHGYAFAWFADGVEITDNTSPEPQALNLTAAHAGAEITVEVTAKRDGYVDASQLSGPTAKVAAAAFTTGPSAGIDGDPVVGGTLTATTGTTVPAAGSFVYAWSADGVAIDGATGRTLALPADLAGARIAVTVTAQRDGFVDATDESDEVEIANARFTTGPTASLSGTAQVGRTLTAGTGLPDPAPASYRYRWLADDAPLAGATGPELTLTADLRGRRIAVEVTAVRPGYDDATDRSAATVPVVTDRAPQVSLRVTVARGSAGGGTPDGTPSVVLGRSFTVSWTSAGADRLTAAGALAEAVADRYPDGTPATGRVTLALTRAGVHGLRLVATNELGSTSAQAAVTAVRPPARLRLTAPSAARPGAKVRIRVAGLGGNERYAVILLQQGQRPSERLAVGRASGAGAFTRMIALPDRTGKVRVRVTGRSTRRTATVVVRLR